MLQWLIFLIGIVGRGVQLGLLGTAATSQLRVIMMMEKLVEWLAEETEVLGETLTQCRFDHHKRHILPGREPGPLRGVGNQRLTAWATARTGD
jgi:hypothetical protein